MTPHPDEVDAVKWVSLEEMDAMMNDHGACFGIALRNTFVMQTGDKQHSAPPDNFCHLQDYHLMSTQKAWFGAAFVIPERNNTDQEGTPA